MSDPDLFVAREAATFEVDGASVYVHQGTIVRAGHPVMAGREYLFEPLVVHFDLPAAGDKPAGDAEPGKRAPRTATR